MCGIPLAIILKLQEKTQAYDQNFIELQNTQRQVYSPLETALLPLAKREKPLSEIYASLGDV